MKGSNEGKTAIEEFLDPLLQATHKAYILIPQNLQCYPSVDKYEGTIIGYTYR